MAELVLMCGVPRSGKSTAARELQDEEGHIIICPDQLRSLIFGHVFRKEIEPLVWFLAEAVVRLALTQGFSVILDATNTHEKAIAKWREVARELRAACRVIVIDTPTETIKERNQGAHSVPVEVLDRMVRQFENFKKNVLPGLMGPTSPLDVEIHTDV